MYCKRNQDQSKVNLTKSVPKFHYRQTTDGLNRRHYLPQTFTSHLRWAAIHWGPPHPAVHEVNHSYKLFWMLLSITCCSITWTLKPITKAHSPYCLMCRVCVCTYLHDYLPVYLVLTVCIWVLILASLHAFDNTNSLGAFSNFNLIKFTDIFPVLSYFKILVHRRSIFKNPFI